MYLLSVNLKNIQGLDVLCNTVLMMGKPVLPEWIAFPC